jgi:hypothetical protein
MRPAKMPKALRRNGSWRVQRSKPAGLSTTSSLGSTVWPWADTGTRPKRQQAETTHGSTGVPRYSSSVLPPGEPRATRMLPAVTVGKTWQVVPSSNSTVPPGPEAARASVASTARCSAGSSVFRAG